MKRLWLVLALAGLVLTWQPAGSVGKTRGLQLGVTGDPFLTTDSPLREEWMGRADSAGANLIYITVGWNAVAPATRPAGFDPSDPGDPAYEWAAVDGAVRSAASRGMQPVLNVNYAPSWAEGPNRPSFKKVPAGAWDPQPQQLAFFSRALAERYSGRFRDAEGRGLPHVRFFEVWAEENLAIDLAPLWKGSKLIGPSRYRLLLNAAYAAIHAANEGAKVIVGGLSPYGDPRPSDRVPPVWYWRSLLCLRGSKLLPVKCPNPAHFDIAAHNPINVGGPETSAIGPYNVSTPNLGRITEIVRKAVQAKTVRPAKPKPFWSTEIWWDSKPPDPDGVPAHLHARFVTKSIYLLWKQGVSAYIWWYIRDQSHATGFDGTQQSGLFYRGGRPKPAYRAFRFPFLGGRGKGGRLFVWGKAPHPGRVAIERRTPRGWATIGHVSAGRGEVFSESLNATGGAKVRARQGGQESLPWHVR